MAQTKDRKGEDERVVEILTEAFADNLSVNYVVKQDQHRSDRIRRLMQYAVASCRDFGEVWLSADQRACALTMLPDRKKFTLASARRDVSLAFSSTGLGNVYKTLRREARIQAHHPSEPFCHLWFAGVEKVSQGNGLGSQLLREIIKYYEAQHRAIYLETSTLRNVPWYQKYGFEVYHELNLTYPLYMMRRTIK